MQKAASTAPVRDRVAGAIMGAFVGDALGMGVHWYYDLAEMHRDHGEWISDYRDPIKGRYHDSLKAGDLTQAGYILKLTLQSLVRKGGYDEADFCRTLDEELLSKLDGTPVNGPGGYTSQSIRYVYRQRKAGHAWSEGIGSPADTTEAAERTLALGALFALKPQQLAKHVSSNTLLTQNDEMLSSMTVAYNAVLALLIQGHRLDDNITDTLFAQVKSGELPFHCVTGENVSPPKPGSPDPPLAGNFASPDALITPSTCAAAAADPNIKIEPAWRVSLVYGMPCAIYHILPACYYLAARFHDDFDQAVQQAVNGGGQNAARTMLTGALVGAQVGLSHIPSRFIDGLTEKEELLDLAAKVAELATQ